MYLPLRTYSSDADQLLAAAMVAYPAGYSKRMYDIWYITSLKFKWSLIIVRVRRSLRHRRPYFTDKSLLFGLVSSLLGDRTLSIECLDNHSYNSKHNIIIYTSKTFNTSKLKNTCPRVNFRVNLLSSVF